MTLIIEKLLKVLTLLYFSCDATIDVRIQTSWFNTVNFGYKRCKYKGFSLIRDYAKGP